MRGKLIFNKPINEVIRQRASVRTYNNKEIEDDIIKKINNYINNLNGPFKEKVRFKIFNCEEEINGRKLGTYGVIKGTKMYIGVAVEKGVMDLEELGYEMEMLVLYLTSIGISTCWIGGTFRKSEFEKDMQIKDNEIFPIISPIGYMADKSRLIEKIIKFKMHSKKRKEWSDLFFLSEFNIPLTKYCTLGQYKDAFENVRLAPSALNKQPWRILRKNRSYHFFLYDSNYKAEEHNLNVGRIDMGIALCHFKLTCDERGIEGEFKKVDINIEDLPKDYHYIISWVEQCEAVSK